MTGKRAQDYLARTNFVQKQLILPGVESTSHSFLRMTLELAGHLEATYKPSLDVETGLLGNDAIIGGWRVLQNVAGSPMSPIATAAESNEELRASLGLAGGYISERHEKIGRALLDLMFIDNPPPSTMAIRREASYGPEEFESSLLLKKTRLFSIADHAKTWLKLVEAGQLKEAYELCGVLFATATGERRQPDKVVLNDKGRFEPKVRSVLLADGRYVDADKAFRIDGNVSPTHFSTRRRLVYAMSAGINYWFAAFFARHRKHYLEEYAFTWKHRTAESIEDKLRKFTHVVGFDVKSFDSTVGDWIIDEFCNRLSIVHGQEWGGALRKLFHCPLVQNFPWVGDIDEKPWRPFLGDPFDASTFTMSYGLPSGITCNPDVGKFAMTFCYLCAIDDFNHDVLEFGLDPILKGRHPRYALLDMGDDAVIATDDAKFAAHLRARAKSGDLSTYFKLEEELPISFLGNVFYSDGGRVKLAPNLTTYLANFLVPETGIPRNVNGKRKYWKVGYRERKIHYSQAPAFGDIHNAFNSAVKKHFGTYADAIVHEAPDIQITGLSSLSVVDRLFLLDPSKIHYRFSPEDISPQLLNVESELIPEDIVTQITEDFIYG